jgi:hypothetical protein
VQIYGGGPRSIYLRRKKAELSATIQNAFETQGRLQQVGKATDAWIRLESQLQMELMIRERIKAA